MFLNLKVVTLAVISLIACSCAQLDASNFDVSTDKTFLELSEALQDPFIRDLLHTPTLAFVAAQSDGKSLFISLRAGYPLTYSASNIGTRCPVRYIFRNSIDIGFEGVKVNGKIVDIKDVMDAVAKHMLALKDADKFSEEELVVQLSFPGMQNAIYLDLPGFPDIGKTHYKQVEKIIHTKVSNPETIVVALMNAQKVDPVSPSVVINFTYVVSNARSLMIRLGLMLS